MSKYIVEKVDDPHLIEFGELVLRNTRGIIAGGVFRDLIEFSDNGLIAFKTMEAIKAERSKDVDVFFRDENDYKHFKNDAESWLGSTVHYNGSNSVGVNIPLGTTMTKSRLVYLDLVHKYFGTPEQILDGFDFSVSQCALYREDDSFYLMYGKDFKNHLHNKVLEYAGNPEKSGNIIERMMRYTSYGFTPNEDTVKKCLISFCKSFEHTQDINIEDLLLNSDFQKYYQKQLEEAEKHRAKGVSSKPHHRGRRKAMFNKQKQMQNEWLSFIYFLLNYWHSTVKVDNYLAASFSSKYAAAHNISTLLEQMSSGYSYEAIDERCGELAAKLGIALVIDEGEEYRWVYSSYSLMKFLEFLTIEKDTLGLDRVQEFLRIMLSSRFVPQSKRNFVRCASCSKSLSGRLCDCNDDRELLLEMESDVLFKVLTHKNDEQWMNDCLNFFSQLYDDQVEEIPTLFEWHHALKNDVFDPKIPPSLMFSLMIDNSMEADSFKSID